MKKVIHPCTIPANHGGRVFCKIEYVEGKLSISGVIGPMKNGDCRGGAGQIDMEFEHRNPAHNDARYHARITVDQMTFEAGWDSDKWLEFLEVWHVWHLNDMQSACEHQRALGWEYGTHQEHRERVETPVDSINGPIGALVTYLNPGECPVCGYRIGSRWLKMDVPPAVIEFLESLPDADVEPAWV